MLTYRLIGQCLIIASFGLLREDHSFSRFDVALPAVQMDRNPGTGDLVAGVMADWAAGENDDMLALVHNGVIAGAPSHALADTHIAIGGHFLHLVEILAVFDVERVAGQRTVSLSRMNMTAEQDCIALVI